VLEKSDTLGGISRTVEYKGNRMDIGGHRFFSKSDRVMEWWLKILPIQDLKEGSTSITYHNRSAEVKPLKKGPDPDKEDRVMLVRKRLSRIYYMGKFFDYPVRLNSTTIRNLGLGRIIKIGLSYFLTRLRPSRKEKNLEDFFINRFGAELYKTFFRDYTEKVWGVPCKMIKPEWGAQRVKGLSVSRALIHGVRAIFRTPGSISQKNIETSLIERFLYPKYGPGHLWEEVGRRVAELGGELKLNCLAMEFKLKDNNVCRIKYLDLVTGEYHFIEPDYVFSSMPVKDLIDGIDDSIPGNARDVAEGLIYRDFIAVGLLLNKMNPEKTYGNNSNRIPDTWVYIQEKEVKVGRIQVFNNWSPYLVKDKDKVWLGLEYFCNEGDNLWSLSDDEIVKLGMDELEKIGLALKEDFIDGKVVRMPKTYPAYFGTYDRFEEIRDYTDRIKNLYLIGRNGMHKYNNQDHSMLTAMIAVDNIISGEGSRSAIWDVNTEEEYHEETGNK